MCLLACATLSAPGRPGWPGGLSGLARDEHGRFWSVAERAHVIVCIEGDRIAARVEVPIAETIDFEALAVLPDGRFAIGTETTETGRPNDDVFVIDNGEIIDRIALPYALWPGFEASANRGIEGLCYADGLIAAVESYHERDGLRWSPLAVRKDERWIPYRLKLTSDVGKISSLACRMTADGVELLAIERHYEVMRVLRFLLPPKPGLIEPELLVDLDPLFAKNPNFEGVEWDKDGLLVLADNQGATISGPAAVLRLPSIE